MAMDLMKSKGGSKGGSGKLGGGRIMSPVTGSGNTPQTRAIASKRKMRGKR